jgi:protein-S-isoprenylcysteine O-methyltransferase Ste14
MNRAPGLRPVSRAANSRRTVGNSLADYPASTLKTRALGRMITTLVILAATLYTSAGSWRFWQAWLFVGLMAGFWTYFLANLLAHSPALVERRLRRKEADPQQKLFQKIFAPITIAAFALTGLDFRFEWSRNWLRPVPFGFVLSADAAAVVGYCFVFWVMKTNAFASSTIQVESGQRVIESGPYALVRHPMYLGMITMALASPFALGSFIALPVFALVVPVLIYRLIHEEQTLRHDLAGYAEYCDRVRYRLVPRVW